MTELERFGRHFVRGALCMVVVLIAADAAIAQSSSLYVGMQQQQPRVQQQQVQGQGQAVAVDRAQAAAGEQAEAENVAMAERRGRLSPAVADVSYAAVAMPEPRQFAVHDLITIIIRESMETDFRALLETAKDVDFDGNIANLPMIDQADLEDWHPRLGLDYGESFDGEGDYRRSESITGRVTARVIDVKPNGNMVLEARKNLHADGEELSLVLTGTCRVEDVAADNTVLSSQLYDLQLRKESDGELRRTTRKGVFTRFLETIFNF